MRSINRPSTSVDYRCRIIAGRARCVLLVHFPRARYARWLRMIEPLVTMKVQAFSSVKRPASRMRSFVVITSLANRILWSSLDTSSHCEREGGRITISHFTPIRGGWLAAWHRTRHDTWTIPNGVSSYGNWGTDRAQGPVSPNPMPPPPRPGRRSSRSSSLTSKTVEQHLSPGSPVTMRAHLVRVCVHLLYTWTGVRGEEKRKTKEEICAARSASSSYDDFLQIFPSCERSRVGTIILSAITFSATSKRPSKPKPIFLPLLLSCKSHARRSVRWKRTASTFNAAHNLEAITFAELSCDFLERQVTVSDPFNDLSTRERIYRSIRGCLSLRDCCTIWLIGFSLRRTGRQIKVIAIILSLPFFQALTFLFKERGSCLSFEIIQLYSRTRERSFRCLDIVQIRVTYRYML